MRAVIDSNVWVSALLNPAGWPARVLEAFANGRFQLVISEPLLIELREVLSRPRIVRKYRVTAADRTELIALLRQRAEIVPVVGTIRICRDPDDDLVLETAVRGRADMVVTRDDDLKRDRDLVTALEGLGVRVVSVRQFLAALDQGEEQG